jgi:hypothetical protein
MAVATRYPAALIVALPLLLPVTTNATEGIPPPDEIRYIEKDEATSDCIGDPKTPLCAVETWTACDVQTDPDICFRAGLPLARGWAAFPGRGRVVYGVVEAVRPPEVAVSSPPASPVEVTLVESNNYFADAWYLDNDFVIRAPYILTRYKVEQRGVKWWVTERAECLGKKRERCRTARR